MFGIENHSGNERPGKWLLWYISPLAKAGKLSPPRLQSARADGTILSYRMASVADTAVPEIWEGDGTLSASLGAHPGMMQITVTKSGKLVVPVFGRVLLLGLWGDLVVASPTTRYEIRAFQGDGTLARIVRRDHLLRAPTEADREKSMEKLLSSRGEVPEPQQIAEALREQRECCPLAKTFPAFSRVIGDAAGHLWVREHDFPGEDGPAPLWTVFDPEGHVLGFIETPKDLWIFEIGEDYLLGRTTDELGVEKVQLWPLER